MIPHDYPAMIVEKRDDTVSRRLGRRSIEELPEGDVLVRVEYSSLNYKDALSATGHPGVTKRFPHTPGIDAAGTVVESSDDAFQPGATVIAFGYDLGMNTPGGFGRYIRIPAGWLVPLPDGLTTKTSMIYGTAGFTAAYSIAKLQAAGIGPDRGEVLVTGASGGVGTVAIALLSQRGYTVTAMSGKEAAHELLRSLGAREIIPRTTDDAVSSRPLDRGRWAGVVDTVGGAPLAQALKEVEYDGAVTCCGLAASPALSTTVYPFILRDVSLIGVDSVNCTAQERRDVWNRLAGEWKLSDEQFDAITTEVTLNEVDARVDEILAGNVIGRTVVALPEE